MSVCFGSFLKRICFLFFFVWGLGVLSAASIDMHASYDKGETIVAQIQATFTDVLTKDNIIFSRGHVDVPFDFKLQKLGDYYYLSILTIGKNADNYTIAIEGVNYYKEGGVTNEPIKVNFSITPETFPFAIDPGIVLANGNFIIGVTSFEDTALTISAQTPNEVSVEDITLTPGQTKSLSFKVTVPASDLETTFTLTDGSETYTIPLYLYGAPQTQECGNNLLESGESCDTNTWGDITGCADFGFTNGDLACTTTCTFDTSSCFNDSQEEAVCGNGIIESGEQCDTKTFGKLDSCRDFNFDAGTLTCDECTFDTSDCHDYKECDADRDCDDDEECISHECIAYECTRDRECASDEICYNHECIDDVECTKNSDCDNDEECTNDQCVPVIPECVGDRDCNDNEECRDNVCVDVVAEATCSELGGRFCLSSESCDGETQNVRDSVCCLGSCTEKTKSSTGTFIGWILLAIIAISIVAVYFKFKRTKSKNADLLKIGSAPRVKGNLLR